MLMMQEMGGRGGGINPSFNPNGFGPQTVEEKTSGFIVTLEGYSPYGQNTTELGKILDPPGAENDPDRSKWGFITRLARLDELVADGNSPFVLYKKSATPSNSSWKLM